MLTSDHYFIYFSSTFHFSVFSSSISTVSRYHSKQPIGAQAHPISAYNATHRSTNSRHHAYSVTRTRAKVQWPALQGADMKRGCPMIISLTSGGRATTIRSLLKKTTTNEGGVFSR